LSTSTTPLLEIVKLDTRLFEKALAGLDRPTLVRRLVEHANPIVWIAAHMAWARHGMASMLGEKPPFALAGLFGRGAAVPAEADLPQADQVLAAWREISEVLVKRLTEASEAQLGAPSPRAFPIADKSILAGLTFLLYHEGYHFGQLALMRKSLGLPGLVDA
jgi:hypothetical protein